MAGLLDVIESEVPKLAKVVGVASPLLASVLGTPLAGVAVSLLASLFGGSTQNIPDLITKIQGDNDAAFKIKQLANQHSEILAQIAANNYSVDAQDREDARKYSGIYRDFLRHFSYIVTIGFFAALFAMFIPDRKSVV